MPRPNRLYIERKTRNGVSLADRGPAVIGDVTYSKTGKTIYYKGMKFKSLPGGGTYGNYCLMPSDHDDNVKLTEEAYREQFYKTYDEFWITGVKKDGSNRYPGFERHPVVENGALD